jgi:hypothetical protein
MTEKPHVSPTVEEHLADQALKRYEESIYARVNLSVY